jgi:hypothetical protein
MDFEEEKKEPQFESEFERVLSKEEVKYDFVSEIKNKNEYKKLKMIKEIKERLSFLNDEHHSPVIDVRKMEGRHSDGGVNMV